MPHGCGSVSAPIPAEAPSCLTHCAQRSASPFWPGSPPPPPPPRTAVRKAIDWDKNTGREYDPRWINLHAVTVYLTASGAQIPDTVSTSVDQGQWPALAEQTRKQFQQDFDQAAAKIQHEEESPEDDDQD